MNTHTPKTGNAELDNHLSMWVEQMDMYPEDYCENIVDIIIEAIEMNTDEQITKRQQAKAEKFCADYWAARNENN